MKRHIQIMHESLESIGVSLEALLGMLASVGILAVIIRLASGKW
jgi:hypothetical protein